MPKTMFPPPVKVGTPSADGSNEGTVLVSQTKTLLENSTNPVTAEFVLPACRIVDIIFDTPVSWNSGTSAIGTVGTAAGGSQIAGGVDVRVAGGPRTRPAFTLAQLIAMEIAAPGSIFATITPSGATSAGRSNVTVIYAPTEV
jgi:hypothetical protein